MNLNRVLTSPVVPRSGRLDKHVAIHISLVIRRIVADHGAVLRIDQIQLPVAPLDPVVAHDQAGRSILQVVAARA